MIQGDFLSVMFPLDSACTSHTEEFSFWVSKTIKHIPTYSIKISAISEFIP